MGFPIARKKDSAKIFPIKPLSVYVLVDEESIGTNTYEGISKRFNNIISRPKFSRLPIEYHILRRNNSPKTDIEKRANDILSLLSPYNMIGRDVEIEEQFTANSEPSDFSIGYLCGEINWNLSFGLQMGLEVFTLKLLKEIRNTAQDIVDFSINSFNQKQIEAAERIVGICEDSLDIHKGDLKKDLSDNIEELRTLLDETTIIRKVSDELTDEMTKTSFQTGCITSNKYGILLKKFRNRYIVVLRIEEKNFPIKSNQQCVLMYFCAIAFAKFGESLQREDLTIDLGKSISPIDRKKLARLNACFSAFKGLRSDTDNLTDQLNKGNEEFSLEFKEIYKKLAYDEQGNFEEHTLFDLKSKVNRIINFILQGQPDAVKEIFKLHSVTVNGRATYRLNIPADCIRIED